MRAGRKHYLKDLKTYLRQLLNGMFTGDTPDEAAIRNLRERLDKLDREIAGVEVAIRRGSRRGVRLGNWLAGAEGGGLAAGLRARYPRWRTGRSTPLWELARRLDSLLEARSARCVDFLRSSWTHTLARALDDED